jgi:LmbE family N-acetylglucosaminyl deacetylase
MNAGVGTLLGVWAHPDDEAYLSAALMAQARWAGNRVVVLTATRGEQGTDDPDAWPAVRLARHREQELAESLRVVGVEEHAWLGYADGSLASSDRRVAVAALGRAIQDVAPDTIVTFGPEGMTGHDDHRTVSSWVTEAWRESGSDAALWYATLTPDFHATWGALNDRVGLWFDGAAPPVTRHHLLAAQVVCTGPLLDLKHRALRAHGSQTGQLEELVGEATYRAWWSTESFVAADRVLTQTGARAERGGRARGQSWAPRGLRLG